MERSLASLLSASFIMSLTFPGHAWTVPEKCRTQACNKADFDFGVHKNCVMTFSREMDSTDYQVSCPWPATRRFYVELMICLEIEANNTCCTHVSLQHLLLMEIHQVYFSLCSYLEDPAVPVLLLLSVPCAIAPLVIPFLCQHFRLHEYRLPNTN